MIPTSTLLYKHAFLCIVYIWEEFLGSRGKNNNIKKKGEEHGYL